jgi:hypothetical protein
VWRTLARRSWLLLAEKQGKVCYDRVMFQYFHLHIQGIGLIMMRNKILWTLAYEIYGKQISTIIIMKTSFICESLPTVRATFLKFLEASMRLTAILEKKCIIVYI